MKKKKRHGTSGSEQCAIGLFGQRRSGPGPVFLQDGGVRPFAQDPSQDPTTSLHRQHGPPRLTWRTLVGPLDPGQHVRSDGQLCPALGKVRASRPLERVDRSPLEVPDDQRQIPSSHDFSDHDYVSNDHKAATRVKQLICNEMGWHHVCQTPYHQRCC